MHFRAFIEGKIGNFGRMWKTPQEELGLLSYYTRKQVWREPSMCLVSGSDNINQVTRTGTAYLVQLFRVHEEFLHHWRWESILGSGAVCR